MKYKITFTVKSLNDHSIILDRPGWRLKDFKKDTNRYDLVSEAIDKLGLVESDIKTFKTQPETETNDIS